MYYLKNRIANEKVENVFLSCIMFDFLSYCFNLTTIYQNQTRKRNITNLRFNFNTLNAYGVFIEVPNIYNWCNLSIM